MFIDKETMSTSLVIVESTAKTKTISKFLGKEYQVLSSVGHIKDLPKGKLGVNIEDDFAPNYITIRGKGKVLTELKKAAALSGTVFIATDPDREGEAIAYHIFEEIKGKSDHIHRILFNEITEHAVREAIQDPLEINIKKVEAQKARRVLDRLVGYQISPILWTTIFRGLSAGRVQSVALRLIVEREAEIEKFVTQEYWTITAELQGARTTPFFSRLIKIADKKPEIPDQPGCDALLNDIRTKQFTVKNISEKEVTRNPAPPFTTSTMQQEAARRLGYSAKKIMMIAQQLYEGIELGEEGSVGLITYMRTDSTRIASEAIQFVREYIVNAYGLEYLPEKPRIFKKSAKAQDAHEAIRPTAMSHTPKAIKRFLTNEQFRLYELIWNRFVACQMASARLKQTSIDIMAGDSGQPEAYLFRTTGSVFVFRGFLQVFEDFKEKNDEEEDVAMAVPAGLRMGEKLNLLNLIPEQHFTKPPARYSESTLVKELDQLGIGRPSTYALIISTLLARKYVEKKERQLFPTELGRTVNQILIHHFPDIFNVTFTASMEEQLDRIEAGGTDFIDVMREFYEPFSKAVTKVNSEKDNIKESLIENTEEKCPKCDSALIVRWGRNGKFMGCSNYPECKYTKPLEAPEQKDGVVCDKCGRPMIVKIGKYGRFMACSGYPECSNAKPYPVGVHCPKEGCPGEVIERRSKRGKTFYGCSEYPRCDFVSWYRPVKLKCPSCQAPFLEERYSASEGEYLYCPHCKTKHERELDAESQVTVEK